MSKFEVGTGHGSQGDEEKGFIKIRERERREREREEKIKIIKILD